MTRTCLRPHPHPEASVSLNLCFSYAPSMTYRKRGLREFILLRIAKVQGQWIR